MDNSNNTNYEKKNKSYFDVNPLSLSYYPKIEMIVKKNNERSLNLSARTPYSKGVDEVQSYRNIRRILWWLALSH